MKILIVDDSLVHRSILRNHLRKMGCSDFVQAASGGEALEKLSNVDLVLTDWNMPGLTGQETVLKMREQNNSVKIVVITSDTDEKVKTQAIEAGANGIIFKPFSFSIINESLTPFIR